MPTSARVRALLCFTWERSRGGAARGMPPYPATSLWTLGSTKLCSKWPGVCVGGVGGDDTATQGCDSRDTLAPPRPVISPLLPARVNNSPGCQMQVTFVAAMKEPGRRGLIFGGQEEVWGIN